MWRRQVATIADAVYGVWAKYRLQVTGGTFFLVLSWIIQHCTMLKKKIKLKSCLFTCSHKHKVHRHHIPVIVFIRRPSSYRSTSSRRSFGGAEEKGLNLVFTFLHFLYVLESEHILRTFCSLIRRANLLPDKSHQCVLSRFSP